MSTARICRRWLRTPRAWSTTFAAFDPNTAATLRDCCDWCVGPAAALCFPPHPLPPQHLGSPSLLRGARQACAEFSDALRALPDDLSQRRRLAHALAQLAVRTDGQEAVRPAQSPGTTGYSPLTWSSHPAPAPWLSPGQLAAYGRAIQTFRSCSTDSLATAQNAARGEGGGGGSARRSSLLAAREEEGKLEAALQHFARWSSSRTYRLPGHDAKPQVWKHRAEEGGMLW